MIHCKFLLNYMCVIYTRFKHVFQLLIQSITVTNIYFLRHLFICLFDLLNRLTRLELHYSVGQQNSLISWGKNSLNLGLPRDQHVRLKPQQMNAK